MKKIFLTAAILCGLWAGSRHFSMNSAAAQAGFFNGIVSAPLTNQSHLTFTNTLVSPTNAASLQLSDVVALLLNLQTNIEETIPALNSIESNAPAPPAPPTNNFGGPTFNGHFGQLTSNPQPLFLPPTGAASGTARPGTETAPPAQFSVRIGTNAFQIDPATLQAIITLRDNLERSLPALQALNGTSPQPTNNAPASFLNPPVANFMPLPITNGFTAPLTNAAQSPF